MEKRKKNKFFKIIISLLLFIMLAFVSIVGFYDWSGFTLYQSAINESSAEERIANIRSKSDYLKLDDIPGDFIDAIIAVEDHRFETHGAVDFIAIARAIYINVTNMELREGGSTITQQFAKNTFFSQESTLERKIAEIFAAIDLENNYSKNDIIEMYVNTIYFGDGYYGINQAANGYFNKKPMELTLDECTLLAGLPNAPSAYSLSNNMKLARQRQKHVISRMLEYGYLSQEQADTLLSNIQKTE